MDHKRSKDGADLAQKSHLRGQKDESSCSVPHFVPHICYCQSGDGGHMVAEEEHCCSEDGCDDRLFFL